MTAFGMRDEDGMGLVRMAPLLMASLGIFGPTPSGIEKQRSHFRVEVLGHRSLRFPTIVQAI